MKNVGIIGFGNIGMELYRKILGMGWNVAFVIKSDGIYRHFNGNNAVAKIEGISDYRDAEGLAELDMVFLAIPTADDGKTALGYIRFFNDVMGIPVITCEKGSPANYFREATEMSMLGYSASVGGGTRLLKFLNERMSPNVKEIHCVLNGTLNYIFDTVARKGMPLGEAAALAQQLGYAEPGAKDILEIINGEAVGDVPMKVCILMNSCGLVKEPIRAKDIRKEKITGTGLMTILYEKRRHIVSFTRRDNREYVIGGFSFYTGDWLVSAGFKRIPKGSLLEKAVPEGVNNSMLVSEGRDGRDGVYILTGPGAGAGPTTASMIKDAENF